MSVFDQLVNAVIDLKVQVANRSHPLDFSRVDEAIAVLAAVIAAKAEPPKKAVKKPAESS